MSKRIRKRRVEALSNQKDYPKLTMENAFVVPPA